MSKRLGASERRRSKAGLTHQQLTNASEEELRTCDTDPRALGVRFLAFSFPILPARPDRSGAPSPFSARTLGRANLNVPPSITPSDATVAYMAGLRRAQEIDQWRPEELSVRDRDGERERVRDRIAEPDAASPVPRAARDSRQANTHEADTRSSTRHARGRSHQRSLSRERKRRPSRGESREGYRSTRRAPSEDRVSHTRRHHHHHSHHRRDSPPSSKRPPTRSPSPHAHKRSKRHRSRSTVRSRSRPRRADTSHRPSNRAFSPRPDRDHNRPRRATPDLYNTTSTARRRRSPSADSYYRPASSRGRKRSATPERKSRRDGSRRRDSPKRHHKSHHAPRDEDRDDKRRHNSVKERHRSRSPSPRHARSPRRRRSPTPERKASPHTSHRDKDHNRKGGSPRPLRRRTSRSPSRGSEHPRASQQPSRKHSPLPRSRRNSGVEDDGEGSSKMRGGAYYQGRGGPQHSYSPNQYPPQGHPGGRGGWSGHAPYPNQG